MSYPGVGGSLARSSLTQRSRWSRGSACVTRSSTMTSEVFAQAVRSYMYVGIWMSISITVILFNKWLLAFAGFPYPISLTLWHMFFCSTVGFLCVRVFKVGRLARLRPRPSRSAQTPDSSPPSLSFPKVRLLAQPVHGGLLVKSGAHRPAVRAQPVAVELVVLVLVGVLHPGESGAPETGRTKNVSLRPTQAPAG